MTFCKVIVVVCCRYVVDVVISNGAKKSYNRE